MSLRARFIAYLVALHLLFILLLYYAFDGFGYWFLGLEALFLVSLLGGIWLVRRLHEPFDFLKTGTDNLKEKNYAIRYLETKQPELDRLIEVYNHMLQTLREERLRLGEQRGFLEKLMRATPAGIITFDFDGRISMLNPSARRFLNAGERDVLGKSLGELNGPLGSALAGLRLDDAKLMNFRGRRLRCQRSRFKDRGFYRDFILIEELTEELRHSEKAAYEKLIRLMSHELNNTVGSTNSLLSSCLIYRDHLPVEDRAEFEKALQVVISRNEHLNRFMSEFANMVRLPDPKIQPVQPLALLRNIALLSSSECERRRIAWEWDIREDPGAIPMDQHQMEQVFMNVVKNAIEAVDRDGRITIRLENHGRPAVSIIDSGRCLTPEVQDHLFLPFFTTKANGQGIGLMLVQEILSRHGFDFALEGGPDQDTRFTIRFASRIGHRDTI